MSRRQGIRKDRSGPGRGSRVARVQLRHLGLAQMSAATALSWAPVGLEVRVELEWRALAGLCLSLQRLRLPSPLLQALAPQDPQPAQEQEQDQDQDQEQGQGQGLPAGGRPYLDALEYEPHRRLRPPSLRAVSICGLTPQILVHCAQPPALL